MTTTSQKSKKILDNIPALKDELVHHLLISRRADNVSRQFAALNSNVERVEFAYELLKEYELLPTLKTDKKDNAISVTLREKGNESYKKKQLKDAWELYNQSIAMAENNSEYLGLAYANRSAVLFEMKLYDECLTDIERALGSNYPDHLKNKLLQRCKNTMNAEKRISEIPYESIPKILSYNERIECASDALEIQSSNEMGRYVIATRDLSIGEVLAVERPYATLIVDQIYCHCDKCLKLCYNLLPCTCCIHTYFCSELCRLEALKGYHKYEGPILATLKYFKIGKMKHLPLRIALLAQRSDLELESDGIYHSARYPEIHDLISNTEKRSVSDLFERTVAAAFIYELIKQGTSFLINEAHSKWFKDILLLHMQTAPSNFHEISELAPNPKGIYEPVEIASGAFSFLSLLNHSCNPNVTRFCYNDNIVLRTIKTVKKGEQLFDNYGYHHALNNRAERQLKLKTQYHFKCQCKACVENWEVFENLKTVESSAPISDEVVAAVSKANVEQTMEHLDDVCKGLEKLQKDLPSRNFCQLQEVLKQAFATLGNKRRHF